MENLNDQELEIQNNIIRNFKTFCQCNGLHDMPDEDTYYMSINPQSLGGWTNCYVVLHFVGRTIEIRIYTKTITVDEVEPRLYKMLNDFNSSSPLGCFYIDYILDRLVCRIDLVADNRDYDVSLIFNVINDVLHEMTEGKVKVVDAYIELLTEKKGSSANNEESAKRKIFLKREIAMIGAELKEEEERLPVIKNAVAIGLVPTGSIEDQEAIIEALYDRYDELQHELYERMAGFNV